MAIPFPYITNSPLGINTGSYLIQKESDMFVNNFSGDVWYGLSEYDVIEFSAFDLNQNPIGWTTLNTEKNYRKNTLSYLNALNQSVQYSYTELLGDLILYKNSKILVNPIEQLSSSFGISQGNYLLTYNFIREMAGNSDDPLIIKDISPSRKEVKLTPLSKNSVHYEAFCRKKFQIKDVAPILIRTTSQCPVDQIFNNIKGNYTEEITFLKNLLFLTTDGAFVNFLKSLYEDIVIYTNPENSNQPLETVKRTQGIKNYFHNFLLSHYESISEFTEINDVYDSIVQFRVSQQFKPYGIQNGDIWIKSKQFLINFFNLNFYKPISDEINQKFNKKYFSLLKNALNFGDNRFSLILDHSFSDERISESDPLTLLIKLKEALPENVSSQTECWISNVSIAPFVVKTIFRNDSNNKTYKIGVPNFSLQAEDASFYNANESYTAETLQDTINNQQSIEVAKRISELQVDYTEFENFILFSSAAQRLKNFKQKIVTWYGLDFSLNQLNLTQSASLSNGSIYPQYEIEKTSIEGKMVEIVNTFDGFEAYLFNSGMYEYNPSTKTFLSASYINSKDQEAIFYDKSNRDSFINNTPEHIVLDAANNDYLMFLNMIGHFFDNLYLYIKNIPSERSVLNDSTQTFTKQIIDFMLESFGWKLGNSYEDLTTTETYLTASSTMSAEDRIKTIRGRILSSLPQIYKSKGTEEAIKMLLSCHGIPSNLLNIREYGNSDFDTGSLVTYTKNERACMYTVSASSYPFWDEGVVDNTFVIRFGPKPNIRTFETKIAIEDPSVYKPKEKYEIVGKWDSYAVKWDYKWYAHNSFNAGALIPCYTTLESYNPFNPLSYQAWRIGVIREYGNMGRVWAELATCSSSIYILGPNGLYSGSYSGSATGGNAILQGTNIQFGSNNYLGLASGSISTGIISNSKLNIIGTVNSYLNYFHGRFSGYWAGGNAESVDVIVASSASFTASYFSGSINRGPIIETSGGIIGEVSGKVTGSILNSTYFININGNFTGSKGRFIGNMSGSITSSATIYGTTRVYGEVTGSSGSFNGNINGTLNGNLITFTPVSINGQLSGSRWEYIDQPFTRLSDWYDTTSPYTGKINFDHPKIILTSSLLPIFDKNIFSVRLRRNNPSSAFQFTLDTQKVPVSYDLTVQRNESGRRIFRSISSQTGEWEDNMIWDGLPIQDTWETTGSLGYNPSGSVTIGTYTGLQQNNFSFGNTMIWDVPISDEDFEIHCNDFNSFAYSGSDPEKHLIVRLDTEEPYNTTQSGSAYETWNGDTLIDKSGYLVTLHPNRSEYYSTFDDLYSFVVASGSYYGTKTNGLRVIETFLGDWSGSVSGSISGSGIGNFKNSIVAGNFSGSSMSGSIFGTVKGIISSSQYQRSGYLQAYPWKGILQSSTNTIFSGSFSGSAYGSFSGECSGTISNSLGITEGKVIGDWGGILSGSLTGSFKGSYADGVFFGLASGSSITVQSIGEYVGEYTGHFNGSVSGELTGSLTGSTGQVYWSGSSPFLIYPFSNYYAGAWYYGQAIYTGSHTGILSSSQGSSGYCDFTWRERNYGSGTFNGWFFQPWTGSGLTLYNKPIRVLSISQTVDAWYPLNPEISSSFSCNNITNSYFSNKYPYEFKVLDLEKTYTTPNFGPNKYRNEKVKEKSQRVKTRLDDKSRSSFDLFEKSSDSNLLGFYLDPQDSKNRDIIKCYGNKNIVDLIGSPTDQFSSSYSSLKTLNKHFNSFGDRKVLYNDLITLYKIYFNRSIFDNIKNLIPARANVRTGIVIEPTILERPKYQHQPIASELNNGSTVYYDTTLSHYSTDPITKLIRFSGSTENSSKGTSELLYAEFNINSDYSMSAFKVDSLPSNLISYTDVSYINETNFSYPVNYNNGYINDFSDQIQFGNFGTNGNLFGFSQAIGLTTQEDLNKYTHSSGSEKVFLVKKWEKHTIYTKEGAYTRISNKNADVYTSNSIWLYNLIAMTPEGYSQLFYTSSKLELSGSPDVVTSAENYESKNGFGWYRHLANTAKNTDNQKINTIRGTINSTAYFYSTIQLPYKNIAEDTYYEIFNGYPRNHYTHKMMLFSPSKTPAWVKGRQTEFTTIADDSGLNDGTSPIQEIEISNVNLIESDNVINQ